MCNAENGVVYHTTQHDECVLFLQDAELLLMQAISLRPETANYHANLGRSKRGTYLQSSVSGPYCSIDRDKHVYHLVS